MKRVAAFFFRTAHGNEPVRVWLLTLSANDRRHVGRDIAVVEYGWPVGMPACKSLQNGLWEVRSHISDGRIARVIFFIHEDRMILLHGFVKKSQKTPKVDLDLANRRKREVEHG